MTPVNAIKHWPRTIVNFDLAGWATRRLRSIPSAYLWGFGGGLALALLAHGFLLCNLVVNEDGHYSLYDTVNTHWRSGRWLLDYYPNLREGYTFPFLAIAYSMIGLALAGCLTAAVWRVRSALGVGAVAGVYASFPAFACAFSYQFIADMYAASCLLAVLAVYFADRERIPLLILGACCLMLSMALYQAFLALVVFLCLFAIMVILNDRRQPEYGRRLRRAGRKILFFGGMGVLGGVFYMLSIKFFTTVVYPGQQLWDYRSMNKMGQIQLSQIPAQIVKTYEMFKVFLSGEVIQYPPYLTGAMVAVLGLAGIKALLDALLSPRGVAPKSINFILIGVLIAAVPVATFFTGVMAPDLYLDILQTFGHMSLLAAAAGLLVEARWKLLRSVALVLVAVMFLGFVNRSNAIHLKGHLYTQASFATANRILGRIEMMPEYTEKSRLAFVGGLPSKRVPGTRRPPFTEPSRGFGEAPTGFADPRTDVASPKITDMLGFFDYKADYARGADIQIAEDLVRGTPMPLWPAPGSIKAAGELIVINLNASFIKELTRTPGANHTIRFATQVYLKPELWEYAWKIFKDGREIASSDYQKGNAWDYQFTAGGWYTVQAFIRCGEVSDSVEVNDVFVDFAKQ